VGGTPIFHKEFIFDLGQWLFCFLPRLVLGSLQARPGAKDSSFCPSSVEDRDADLGND